jgi:hypothetical protein
MKVFEIKVPKTSFKPTKHDVRNSGIITFFYSINQGMPYTYCVSNLREEASCVTTPAVSVGLSIPEVC